MIVNYGNVNDVNNVHLTLALSIIITAILTLLVHTFYAHRILMISRRNYFLTTPIITLAILRLVSATVTTAYLLKLHTFSAFKHDVRWIFTIGLALSSAVDIMITTSLCVLLQTSRSGLEKSNAAIDSLIKYTFETGALTCAATIASMLCWSINPGNLIFMGLHFVIGKLYANSLLVSLNTREGMREKLRRARSRTSAGDQMVPVHIFRHTRSDSEHVMNSNVRTDSKGKIETLEVTVEQSVQYS